MKLFSIFLLLLPVFCHAQIYDRSSADKFHYIEIGDTVFINNSFLVPGDTLFLGKGSAPDGSFLNIYEFRKCIFFVSGKFLPKESGEQYLIYKERKKNRGFFSYSYTDYNILFTAPGLVNKIYSVNWYAALETHEIHLR